MDRICRIVLNVEHKTGGLSKDRLTKRFVALAERFLENDALFEVIWLLYAIRGMRQPFASNRIASLSESVLPVAQWASDIQEKRVTCDWTWLFAYEAIRKGWLPDRSGLLNKSFFKPLNDRNVVFYDPGRNVQNSASLKKGTSAQRKRQSAEADLLLQRLRGFHNLFGADDY